MAVQKQAKNKVRELDFYNQTTNSLMKLIERDSQSLEEIADRCALHQTTGLEQYREKVVGGLRLKGKVGKFYNIFIFNPSQKAYEELMNYLEEDYGIPSFEAIKGLVIMSENPLLIDGINELEKVAQDLTDPVDVKLYRDYKTHCVGCEKPNEICQQYRQQIMDKSQYAEKRIEEVMGKICDVGIPIAFQHAKEHLDEILEDYIPKSQSPKEE